MSRMERSRWKVVRQQHRNLLRGAVEVPQSSDSCGYLLEIKGPSDEMVPQQIDVSQSSRDRYAVLVALQWKLERSPWCRECLCRAREPGWQERSWCRTVHPEG